ncbi:MAG: RnfABCDGE type electron transport complex subunit D [Gemmatimonadota bacterium]|nr:MAG: RnfABCDGE type electron transport complex subunit D [Gemmatimonadota bacterium]
MSRPRFLVTASPHLRGPATTPTIMWNVVGSLVPIILAATFYFGIGALLVIGSATAGAMLTEALFGRKGSLGDGSAAITGLLLGLILPPGFPLWMAFIGGVVSIAFGKLIFGGLGQNIFNPALLGRAFLQAAFPVAITTWVEPRGGWLTLPAQMTSVPFMGAGDVDVVTSATPLGLWKFERIGTELWNLMVGHIGGSLGETSGLLIIVCGGYLALRNFLNWRIPISIFISVAVLSGLLHLIDASRYPSPLFMLFSGGLMLGAWFMATDMVTSPVTNKGCWVFGAGVGALVVIIRAWGGMPEGVMYAILLMNALVPYINEWTQPKVFGTRLTEAPS